MHIKRFTAQTVKDALRAAKAEFGEEALILGTRRTKGNPYSPYEVIAAVDYDLSRPVDVRLAPEAEKGGGRETGGGALVERELDELKGLKDLLWLMIEDGKSALSALFQNLEEELAGVGVDRRLAKKILLKTAESVSRERINDEGHLRGCMKDLIFQRLRVTDPLKEKGVTVFVGAAGVGKTTTIAKLAAEQSLRRKKRVALITMDVMRPAAKEELGFYGRSFGVPVEVALTPREAGYFVKMHSDKDLVLVDTAGRNLRAAGEISELKELSLIDERVKFNLVLSATARDNTLYESVRALRSFPIDSLTFTRLDEADSHGPILNTMMLSKKPVAYLTAGRRVPEDLEVATRERLFKYIIAN